MEKIIYTTSIYIWYVVLWNQSFAAIYDQMRKIHNNLGREVGKIENYIKSLSDTWNI